MTTQREIAETLRNPAGAYFCENSPAMVALETMIDTVGIANVLYALGVVSSAKADHLQANWQDDQSAQWWIKRAEACEKLAARPFMHDAGDVPGEKRFA